GVTEDVFRKRVRSAAKAFEVGGNGPIKFPWEVES
ncbi:MAG: hypothetical protein ACI80N_004119, partial [Gammaproteobacteria bacterium]